MSKRGLSSLETPPLKKQAVEMECLKTDLDFDRRCFERIAKLVDNRHDFKPAGRNQSIDNRMVLRILNDFKNKLTQNKPSKYTDIYTNLLTIHCSDYQTQCEKTTINIDKDAEHEFESYFNQTLSLSSIPTVSWEKFSTDSSLNNHIHVMIGDKKELYKLLPTKEKPTNNFLETLMSKLRPYLEKKDDKDINFVIDTCALSELAFTTMIDKQEDKNAQTNIQEAKNHSRIYIGNGTDLDIFNKALPTTGSTRLEIEYCADTEIKEDTNHLILKTMNTIDQFPHWSWKSKNGNREIKFVRDQEKTRFGVEKFSMLILNAMNTRSKDKELLNEFQKITGINHENISVIDYGKHVFDIKRLMDTSQIMYAWTLNQIAKNSKHPLYPQLQGKEFIFITIDYMASCIARLLGLSVIYTNRNPHTKKYSFTIHLNKNLNPKEKELLTRKQTEENKHRYDMFKKQLSTIPNEPIRNLPELHPFDFNYESKSKKETRIKQSGEMIFYHLIKLFERYLIQCLNLIQSYKNLQTNSYDESYRLKNHIFMESHLADEYNQLKRIYTHFNIHKSILIDSSIHIKTRVKLFVNEFQNFLIGLSYFKFTPLLHLIQSFNHGDRNLEYPIYLILASTGRGRNLETILYKSHPSAVRSEVYGFDKWINAFVYFQDLIFNEWCIPKKEKIDTSLNFEEQKIKEEIYNELKSFSEKPLRRSLKGGGPSGNSDSILPYGEVSPRSPSPVELPPLTQDQPVYDLLAPGSPSPVESPNKQKDLQTEQIYNELNSRYGYIPYDTFNDFKDFEDYLNLCQKADLVKMLGLSLLNKQEKRLEYEQIVHPMRKTFLQELDKPIRRATIGGSTSKFVKDYIKHLKI